MKALFVAATGQDAGKTTTCVGLMHLLQSMGLRTGFIKPVGQSYVEVDDITVDKDALLMKVVYDLPDELCWMSPVIIPAGFTTEYINNREKYGHLKTRITEAFSELARDKDVIIVEGTGHAGVGSVVDLSNATVARLLGAEAVVVTGGGIGSAIDELMLNTVMMQSQGVAILGTIVNKVLESKYEKIRQVVSADLEHKQIAPLGFLPFKPLLSMPHMHQIKKCTGASVLCGAEGMNEFVENVVIAAMSPQNLIGQLKPGSLVLTPADRIDNILVAVSSHLLEQNSTQKIAGLLLAGGGIPGREILDLLQNRHIPVLYAEQDTYTVASRVFSLTVKTQASDLSKLKMIQSLYADHVDRQALETWVKA